MVTNYNNTKIQAYFNLLDHKHSQYISVIILELTLLETTFQ
jgi:hypothetical protein